MRFVKLTCKKASRRASGQVAKRKRKSQASNGAHLCCAFKDASARADATAKQLGSDSEKDAAARALADEEANKARILAAVAAEDSLRKTSNEKKRARRQASNVAAKNASARAEAIAMEHGEDSEEAVKARALADEFDARSRNGRLRARRQAVRMNTMRKQEPILMHGTHLGATHLASTLIS